MITGSAVEASHHGGIAQRSRHPKSLTVFGAITSDGKTPLISSEKWVKVDGKTYLEGALSCSSEQNPISATGHGLINRTQLQHTGPVQRTCQTTSCRTIAPKQSRFKSLDYSVWSALKTKACSTQHRSSDALRATLIKA
uniref:Pyridoxamine 5'-phosphate oxidase n=1 Tax=Haemonchus placei TaxID=6290 RepID=A0A0N4W483_HAEPC